MTQHDHDHRHSQDDGQDDSQDHAHHALGASPAGDVVDVAVIGGASAGLAAALMLGRSRRSVVVIDAGDPRNAVAAHMHGYLGHDGIAPTDFLALARDEVRRYGVTMIDGSATEVVRRDGSTFAVRLADGATVIARRVVVATGVRDELPPVTGLAGRWGRDVLHCPFCHGYEVADQRIAILSTGPMAVHQTLQFRQLSTEITLLLHTGPVPSDEERLQLASRGVRIVEGEVDEVVVEDDRVTAVRLADGTLVATDAIVVAPRFTARAGVLASLGIEPVEHPMGFGTMIEADASGKTSVPGVWVAGNVHNAMGQVLQAAASAAMTGALINGDLVTEDTARAVATALEEAAMATPEPVLDRAFWENRYRSSSQIWSGNPNPQLVADIGGLAPGSALDVGSGEGADAIWLAERGWTVHAVDISSVALDRGRAQSEVVSADVAARITWEQADLLEYAPPASTFDLVSAQFMHFPSATLRVLLQQWAAAVAPGGVLLIVGHHPMDMHGGLRGHRPADLFFTAEQLAAQLDDGWDVVAADTRARQANGQHGDQIDIHDAVLVARRRA